MVHTSTMRTAPQNVINQAILVESVHKSTKEFVKQFTLELQALRN